MTERIQALTISVYKVQNVLSSYLKQLKASKTPKEEEERKIPVDNVSISSEAKKKNTQDRMGEEAVRNLHDWALKPLKEDQEEN